MASNLPKFGNWDTEGDVNYTTCFENARRGSSSEQMNTNNPRDNHNMISKQEAEALKRGEVMRMKLEQKISQEDGELRRSFDSPSHHNGRHRASGDSTSQQPAGESSDASKRTARPNGAGFPSADHSPLHPHYQAKIGIKGSAISSPSQEKKGSLEGTPGLAPSTPGRSRLRSVPRGSETVISSSNFVYSKCITVLKDINYNPPSLTTSPSSQPQKMLMGRYMNG